MRSRDHLPDSNFCPARITSVAPHTARNTATRPEVESAAGAFYLLLVAGLVVFVISPGIEAGTPSRVAWRGAFFGLIAYATYDLTNLATLDRWPLLLTVADMAWGTSLCAAHARRRSPPRRVHVSQPGCRSRKFARSFCTICVIIEHGGGQCKQS